MQGTLTYIEVLGEKSSRRLIAFLRDETGILELTWFRGIAWMEKILKEGEVYIAFGKLSFFNSKAQIVHPEIELAQSETGRPKNLLEPVYATTEKLKARGMGGRQLGKLVQSLIAIISPSEIKENIPENILHKNGFINRYDAYINIHFPKTNDAYLAALQRLKFEELFMSQMRLILVKSERHRLSKGVIFKTVGELFNSFYKDHLPFELTGAQKRVLKEIRHDTITGHQMNRLLQGDVGSGKTIVALLVMLLAIDNGFQTCLMAPTEILSQQHLASIKDLVKQLPVSVELLAGSIKKAERKRILQALIEGNVSILIGTHALIEEVVQFKK